MTESTGWDWGTREKIIADVNEWKKRFPVVQECIVSNDGEKIAAIVEAGNKQIAPCMNGTTWEETFERVWSLYSPLITDLCVQPCGIMNGL